MLLNELQGFMYVLEIRSDAGSDLIRIFRGFDSATNAFYAEVGRDMIQSNIDTNGETDEISIEFAKFTGNVTEGQIGYYASKNYATEITLRIIPIE